MLSDDHRQLELKVGIFAFLGLLLTASLVVHFGRLSEPFKAVYQLTVHFSNASGLLSDANVFMGGARIGRVAGSPEIPEDRDGVIVRLNIYASILIPKGSEIKIRSSGLLSDTYVDVLPKKGKQTQFISPGSTIQGTIEGNIGNLSDKGEKLLENLMETNLELKLLLEQVNQRLLNDVLSKNLHSTLANTRAFTEKLSNETEPVLHDLSETLESLKGAASHIESSSEKVDDILLSLDTLLADGESIIKEGGGILEKGSEVLEKGGDLLEQVDHGNGALSLLLNDQQLSEDMKTTIVNLRYLVTNLKKHGIIFYKDSSDPEVEEEESRPGSFEPPSPRIRRRK